MTGPEWPLRLFHKSILKQAKFQRITDHLGPTDGQRCLDIGSDNGVFSLLLRQRGGEWKSADIDERSVAVIKELVGEDVYQIDGECTPFLDNEFDRVVIVDFLEHIHDDQGFMREVYRILKPNGRVIINAPYAKDTLLQMFRTRIGLTDAWHGHLRPGYTLDSIEGLLTDRFTLQSFDTYTKFFSKLIDTLMVYAITLLKGNSPNPQEERGILITGSDLDEHRMAFGLLTLVYPFIWLVSKLDKLLFFEDGYMLIAKAEVNKA